jgi:hypothetical protein
MLKWLLEKWRPWGHALVGIDDVQGDHLLSLEKRIALLEATVAHLNNISCGANQPEGRRAQPEA